ERFVDCSPDQVYFTLLDEGTYIASVSSFYRILRANGEVKERRAQATHPAITSTSTSSSTSSAVTSSRGTCPPPNRASRPRTSSPMRSCATAGTPRSLRPRLDV